MIPTENPVARAFELAKAGNCRTIKDVRACLKREGYADIEAHLHGALIKRQLSALMKASRYEVAAR